MSFYIFFKHVPNMMNYTIQHYTDSSLCLLVKIAYLKFFSKMLNYLSFKLSKCFAVKTQGFLYKMVNYDIMNLKL